MSLRGGSPRCIDSGASCWALEYRRGPGRAWCGNCGKVVDLTFDEPGPPRYIEHRMSGRPIRVAQCAT